MKPTFIPDYLRHTEFTPTMRIILTELASKRNLYVVKFMIARIQYEEVLDGKGRIEEADLYYQRMQDYLDIIEEVDQSVREIYFLHGRLN